MAIVFDEISAEIAPPAPTTGAAERQAANGAAPVDAQSVLRELQRLAERAARLSAD
ncbi:MAG: hypothetical protein ACYDC1_05880 [Limisphaerales bacterium]